MLEGKDFSALDMVFPIFPGFSDRANGVLCKVARNINAQIILGFDALFNRVHKQWGT